MSACCPSESQETSSSSGGTHASENPSTATSLVQSGELPTLSKPRGTRTSNVMLRVSPGAIHGAAGRHSANV